MAVGDTTINIDAFALELDRASTEIKREVGALIPIASETLATALEARYPIGKTGRLHHGVRIVTVFGGDHLLPGKRVTGPQLAYIWQDGTVERRNITRANAYRGRSPAHDPGMFQRLAVQTRTAMLTQAQALLDRNREI